MSTKQTCAKATTVKKVGKKYVPPTYLMSDELAFDYYLCDSGCGKLSQHEFSRLCKNKGGEATKIPFFIDREPITNMMCSSNYPFDEFK